MMMSFFKKVSLLSILVLGTAAAHGQATGSAKGKFVVTHSKLNFTYNDASHAYLVSQMNTKVQGNMVAKGLLNDINGPVNVSTNQVLGKDLHGKIVLRVDLNSGTPKLNWEFSIRDQIEVVRVQANTRFTTPLVITEGSIDGYNSGDTVVFDLSDEGAEAFAAGLQEGLQELVQSGLSNSALKPAMGGMKIKSKIKNIQVVGPMRIMVSKKRISIPSITVNYEIALSASL